MTELVLKVKSAKNLNLLKGLAAQLGEKVISTREFVSSKRIENKPFVALSESSLMKEWSSDEDSDWDDILTEMPAIK